MNAPKETLLNKRILTVSFSGEQRYSIRKESRAEHWVRVIRENETYISCFLPWTPSEMATRGEWRQFAGLRYQCTRPHLMMSGYEPDKTPALWKSGD